MAVRAENSIGRGGEPGPALPDNNRLHGLGQPPAQAEYDRNLIILWEAVGFARIGPNYENVENVRRRLPQILGAHPDWVEDRERRFVNLYSGLNPCPSTPESADTIRSLLRNRRLQETLFRRVVQLEPRVYSDLRQPMTLVPPEISVFERVRMLEFGNDQLFRQPIDLRALSLLRFVDIRDCGLQPEDLIVSRRVTAMIRNNDHHQILPDALPNWMSSCASMTRVLTEYRGENSSLISRIGFTICYFGLLMASIVETLARGVFTVFLSPFMLLAYALDPQNLDNYDMFDMTVVGTVGCAINILACGHALYANLATRRTIRYAELTFGLSHKPIFSS
ncbi:MAG: hypothetical protein ACHQT8_01410 [Chlamydiales bacterium]